MADTCGRSASRPPLTDRPVGLRVCGYAWLTPHNRRQKYPPDYGNTGTRTDSGWISREGPAGRVVPLREVPEQERPLTLLPPVLCQWVGAVLRGLRSERTNTVPQTLASSSATPQQSQRIGFEMARFHHFWPVTFDQTLLTLLPRLIGSFIQIRVG